MNLIPIVRNTGKTLKDWSRKIQHRAREHEPDLRTRKCTFTDVGAIENVRMYVIVYKLINCRLRDPPYLLLSMYRSIGGSLEYLYDSTYEYVPTPIGRMPSRTSI